MSGLLDAIAGSTTPDDTGLSDNERRKVLFSGIGQLGASLLAAGQPMDPSQRAPYIQQIGNIPGQMEQQTTQLMQQRLIGQKGMESKREADILKSPEFQAALAKLPPELQAVARLSPASAIAAVNQHRQMLQADQHAAAAERGLNQRAALAGQRDDAANERLRLTLQNRSDVAGAKPIKPGEVRNNPDGSTDGVDIFGRPTHTPAPTAPQGDPASPSVSLSPQQKSLISPRPVSQGGGDPTPTEATQGVVPTWNTEDLPGGAPFNRDAEAFRALPDDQKQAVHEMAMYRREPIPSGSRSRLGPALNGALAAYTNGGYDVNQFKTLGPVMKEFSQAGVTGRGLTATDTAYGHLALLHDVAMKMKNGEFPTVNAIDNYIKTKTGDPSVTNFTLIKTAVGTELAKSLQGSGVVPVQEMEHWQNAFKEASSPAQLHEAITNAMRLMEERTNAAKHAFKRDTGRDYTKDILSPEHRKAADFIKANPIMPPAQSAPQAAPGEDPRYEYRDGPNGREKRLKR
ncbi:hypothetical protein UFOVP1339_63 [uncultured Caudovirales phage]|uniref:Uncharacterized protein n=1 Tax=uncultured Caudovirales phage TaxID=2100421 RepID=A0A6J5S0V4_9CAUD|nr:hypothetical protein UFOVP1339_63 [uncultured Caudovirales phage]